jgi:hypothetical protein
MSRSPGLLRSASGDTRHRTLDEAIDWSYQLLEPSEQTLLRRLAVFVGGSTLEAAETICTGDEPDDLLPTADDVFLNLAELVSKSLVVFDSASDRYRMLEPIRFFARLKFEASGDATTTLRRHATWVHRSSQGWLMEQMSGGPLAEPTAELDNVHAALSWLRAIGDDTAYMRIVAVSGITWLQSEWRRGREACEVAMQMASATTTSARLRAAVTLSRGMVEQRVSPSGSVPFLEDAAAQHAGIGDEVGRAWSLFFLGRGAVLQDRERGTECLEEAIALFTRLGQPVGAVWSLVNLVTDANDRGDFDTSRVYLLRAREVVDRADLVSGGGIVLCELGFNAVLRGEIDEGRALLRDGVALQRRNSDRWNLIGSLSHAAWAELTAGALDAAEALLVESIQITLELEDAWQRAESMLVMAVLRMRAGDDERARAIFAATGWDIDTPFQVDTHRYSIVALAITALEPLLVPRYDAPAREGRRIGSIPMAMSLVGATEPR